MARAWVAAVTLPFLAAAVALAASSAVPPPPTHAALGWQLLDCVPEPNGRLDFDVVLHWAHEPTSHVAHGAAAGTRTPSQALARVRDAVKPTAEAIAEAHAWLATSMPASAASRCRVEFDTIKCVGVPAIDAATLVASAGHSDDVKLCRFVRADGRSKQVVHRASQPLVAGVHTPKVVAHVAGLSLGNAYRNVARVHKLGADDSPVIAPHVQAQAALGAPTTVPVGQSAAPVLLSWRHTMESGASWVLRPGFATVALNCLNSKPTNATAGSTDAWCGAGGASLVPRTLTVTDIATNASATITVSTSACSSTTTNTSESADKLVAICTVDLGSIVSRDRVVRKPYELLNLTATATYANGSSFTAPFRAFYGGRFNDIHIYANSAHLKGPSEIRSRYNIPFETSAPRSRETTPVVGVLQLTSLQQAHNPAGLNWADVAQFLNDDRAKSGGPRVSETELQNDLVRVIGNLSSVPGIECPIDVEWALGIAPVGTRMVLWNVEYGQGPTSMGAIFTEAMANFSSQVISPTGPLSQRDTPITWTISYGSNEFQDEGAAGLERMRVIARNFALLSAAGISVVAAAGDFGSQSEPTPSANSPTALFPSSAPAVLAVGGTALVASREDASNVSEITCMSNQGNAITTGGGFSHFFGVPAYQANVVHAYRPSGRAAGAPLTPSRRATPDVAMLASFLQLRALGSMMSMYGTSVSAPMFAGVVLTANRRRLERAANNGTSTAVNDTTARLDAPGLRLLPALFYAHTSTVRRKDITVGDNCPGRAQALKGNLANFAPSCYSAEAGWDAVSGIGTVDGRAFIEIAMSWAPRLHEAENLPDVHDTVITAYIITAVAAIFAIMTVMLLARSMGSKPRPDDGKGLAAAGGQSTGYGATGAAGDYEMMHSEARDDDERR